MFVKNFESIQAKQNVLRLETRDFMVEPIQVLEKILDGIQKVTNNKLMVCPLYTSDPANKALG